MTFDTSICLAILCHRSFFGRMCKDNTPNVPINQNQKQTNDSTSNITVSTRPTDSTFVVSHMSAVCTNSLVGVGNEGCAQKLVCGFLNRQDPLFELP